MKNKFLSTLLALCLLLTLLPTAALADDGDESTATPTHDCDTEGHAVDKDDKNKCAYCGRAITDSGTWKNVPDGSPNRLYGTGTWNLSADGTLTVLGDDDTVAKVTDDITTGINKAGHAVTTVTGTAANATVTTEGKEGEPETTVVYTYGDIVVTVTFTASKTDDGWEVAATPSVTATKDGYEVLKSIDDKTFTVQKTTSGSGGSTSISVVATVTATVTGTLDNKQVAIKITKGSDTTQFTVKTTAYSGDADGKDVAVTTSLSTGEGEELIAKTATSVYASGDQAGTIYHTTTSTGDDDDDPKKEIYGTGELPNYGNSEYTPWADHLASVKKIVVGAGITAIGGSNFCDCENLTKVVLPEGLKKIGDSAFSSCTTLTRIDIPKSVTKIGSNVFGDCTSLTEIKVAEGNANYKSVDGVLLEKNSDGANTWTLHTYLGGKTDTSYTIDEGVTAIKDDAFNNALHLTAITLPTTLGEFDLSRCGLNMCEKLTDINVAEGAEGAAGNKYYSSQNGVLFNKDGTTLLCYPRGKTARSYTIPSGVTTIGVSAFQDTTALTSITIPDSVTAIGRAAFTNSGLTEITIPKSVTNLGYNEDDPTNLFDGSAFEGTSLLTKFTVAKDNEHYKSIDGVLFKRNDDDTLTLIRYPGAKAGLYTIPSQDDGGKSVTVTAIERRAFESSMYLTSVSIPAGVTTIGRGAFAGSMDLVSVFLPNTVTSIGVLAFENCHVLKDVYYAGDEDEWGGMEITDKELFGVADDDPTNTALDIDATRTTIHYSSDGTVEITLDPNGGDLPSDAKTEWTTEHFEPSSYKPSAPTRSGYSFAGWIYTMKVYDWERDAYSTVTRVWNWDDPVYADMELTAKWSRNSYSIDVAEGTKNGTVTTSPTNAHAGTTVTVTVTPDDGYMLGSLTVTDRGGNVRELTKQSDGTYTFVMPGRRVTVEATFVPEMPFVDVPVEKYFYCAVRWAVENGIVGGVDATHFAPYASCTRGQLVTFLWRAAGEPAATTAANPFTDVKETSAFYQAILWASENNIVGGYDDGTFRPSAAITRQQAAAILYRYAEFAGLDVSASDDLADFKDAQAISAYALPAVKWAVGDGILWGSNGYLLPASACTRAQIVSFLYRFLG